MHYINAIHDRTQNEIRVRVTAASEKIVRPICKISTFKPEGQLGLNRQAAEHVGDYLESAN